MAATGSGGRKYPPDPSYKPYNTRQRTSNKNEKQLKINRKNVKSSAIPMKKDNLEIIRVHDDNCDFFDNSFPSESSYNQSSPSLNTMTTTQESSPGSPNLPQTTSPPPSPSFLGWPSSAESLLNQLPSTTEIMNRIQSFTGSSSPQLSLPATADRNKILSTAEIENLMQTDTSHSQLSLPSTSDREHIPSTADIMKQLNQATEPGCQKRKTSTSSNPKSDEECQSSNKLRKIGVLDENNNYSFDPTSSDTENEPEMEVESADEDILSSQEDDNPQLQKENRTSHQQKTKNAERTTPLPPINATLSSEGLGKVILIRPVGDKFMSFTRSPAKFAKAFADSAFGKADTKSVRVNKIKNIVAVELENPTQPTIDILLQITKIGTWTVICSLPIKDKLKFGVISPIDLDEDLDILKEMIEKSLLDDLSLATVFKIERLNRKSSDSSRPRPIMEPSTAVRITFVSNSLPNNIKIGHMSYNIRPFIFPPTQCFKCARLGHVIGSCKSTRDRCKYCAKDHQSSTCTSNTYKCANCSGNHPANSSECPLIKQAMEIEKLRSTGLTYNEARTIIIDETNHQSQEAEPTRNERSNQEINSYSKALRSKTQKPLPTDGPHTRQPASTSRTIETQTPPQPSHDIFSGESFNLFMDKLGECFVKILTTTEKDTPESNKEHFKEIIREVFLKTKNSTNHSSDSEIESTTAQNDNIIDTTTEILSEGRQSNNWQKVQPKKKKRKKGKQATQLQ